MTRVLHLFDGREDWEQRVAVTQLLQRLAGDQCRQTVASLDARVPRSDWFGGVSVIRAAFRSGIGLWAAPAVRRLIEKYQINVIHAWGVRAAVAASAARPMGCSLVVARFDPVLKDREARFFRTIAQRAPFAISCTSETVRRRLIEKGVDAGTCVVVRPGVDFAVINATKRNGSLRSALGLSPDDRVIVASHPVTCRGGHERVVRGGQLGHVLDASYRTIIYGCTPERDRLQRLSNSTPFADAILWPGSTFHYEQLIAIADAHVITPGCDVPTTSIAWAMAASVPVIGSAVYSVAELIAHKHTGLLIKPESGPAMAVRIAACLDELDTLVKEKEVARGQAYRVFGVRRFADQHLQLYNNLAAGAAPGENIKDSALE